ncbi:MAG: MerR family transcriptional regulator [Xanthobacteraceae bacterium]
MTVAVGARALTIGALAERTGCNVPTIRYYEEIGLLPPPRRGAGGQRTYAEGDFARLTFIRRCRDFDFSIEQVRELVALVENPERDCVAAKDLAETHLSAVRAKLRELRALEKSLSQFATACAAQCAGGPASDCVILDEFSKSAKCGC